MTSPARQTGQEMGQGNHPSPSSFQSGQDFPARKGRPLATAVSWASHSPGHRQPWGLTCIQWHHPGFQGNLLAMYRSLTGVAEQTPLLAPSLLTAPSSLTMPPTQSRYGPQARPAPDGESWRIQLHLHKDLRSMWGRSRTPRKQERPRSARVQQRH